MALGGTGNTWGDTVYDAVVDVSDLNGSEQVQVRSFWRAVCSVHAAHIVSRAVVQTTSGAPDSEHEGEIQ